MQCNSQCVRIVLTLDPSQCAVTYPTPSQCAVVVTCPLIVCFHFIRPLAVCCRMSGMSSSLVLFPLLGNRLLRFRRSEGATDRGATALSRRGVID